MNIRIRSVLWAVFLSSVLAATGAEKAANLGPRMVDDARLAALESAPGERAADIILELALAYDERGQTTKALEYYQQAAALGVGAAELRLGWLCESGTKEGQSYALARSHYERAVAAGVPEANLRLGFLYLEGWGVTRDVPAAVRYLQAAANAGYPPAQKILSEMYFSGTGVATDLKQALFWAEKAATKNDPEAQTTVGAIHQKAARLPQDILVAREWYQLSAEQEHTAGMRAMASTFLKRGANAEAIRMGLRWLELASDNGDGAAAFYLAGAYLMCPLVKDEPGAGEKARARLNQSAQAGEYAAREVLEMAGDDQALAGAFYYVTKVPMEERYVRHLAARPLTAEEIASKKSPPIPLKAVSPIYPRTLEMAKIEGDVVVEMIVDQTGRVRAARVVSSTHQGFADLALASAVQWRFRPGYVNGSPVNVRIHLPVQFRITKINDGPRKKSSLMQPATP